MSKIVTKMFKANEIDTAILKVADNAKSLQQKIHNLAISTLKIWHDNGDFETAIKRLNALQQASPYHSNAFSKWIELSIPSIEWSKENKSWFIHKDNGKLKGKAFMAARDLPFWKVKPATVPQPMILGEDIERLIKRAENRRDKPVEGDVIDVAVLKLLRQARDLKAA
jgi:hypothetical protein